ncbi:MAG: family 10 glycosylhydrolase [Ignavibacteriae bacterium]|nr:family 10 glycosylhydrolase [Ignavibacteriota bacterium]
MNSTLRILLLSFLVACSLQAQPVELRGVWVTPRSGSGFWSKGEIARCMDSIANNNFNVVFFNAWSRGWPLWRSDYFFGQTGYYTDPAAGTRDILQEAIAEAHRRGLEIEAWGEYGFVVWWTGNTPIPGAPKGPLLARHPNWTAKKRDGSDDFESGSGGVFYWLSHNHDDARRFLIDLHREIAERYDVDGIELDRIRYPQTPLLDCGYDSASVAQYTAQFGVPPPQAVNDPQWMRWRADRLISFQRAAYDSIKAANPHVHVSNAPSHYSSGSSYSAYENVLQDWRAWLNIGKLDAAQIQMYVQPNLLQSYIPSALNGVQDSMRRKCYAGVAPKTASYTLDAAGTIQLITTSRNAGLRGQTFWYYNDLIDLGFLGVIKAQAYQTQAAVPDRRVDWRDEGRIDDDTSGNRSSGWININLPASGSISAWNRNFAYASDSPAHYLDYRVNAPAAAFYEVYVYQAGPLLNVTSAAPFEIFESNGTSRTVLVDQSNSTQLGWHKLGDVHLAAGNQLVARLTNNAIGSGRYVVADAMMLVLNRKLSPSAIINAVEERSHAGSPTRARLLVNFPNPFNPSTTIRYELPAAADVSIDVYDTLGKRVHALVNEKKAAGLHAVSFRSDALASGVYLVRLRAGDQSDARKILLVR